MNTPDITLNNGVTIPQLGLGVYQSRAGRETRNAVRAALEAGYRHIDTAMIYGNEKDVGDAVRDSGLPREQVFVTTKLWNDDHGYDQALAALDASLQRLRFDYIDLYLIHWPQEDLRLETWRAMERILASGKARAIGVSNYMVRHLTELLAVCQVPPAVNQIELSPFIYRSRASVVALCEEARIAVEAYSPLTKGKKLDHPALKRIAKAHGKTPAQILIRYCLEHNWIVIPKSVHKARIVENMQVFDFSLRPEELVSLDALDEGLATGWDPTDAP
jgi:diketogulonate reductase-like aldo/keto reductase